MKTIDEKAWDYSDSRRKDADLTDIATAYHDGYIQGATEALQSQWRNVEEELPTKSDDYIVAYEDGTVFTEYFVKRINDWRHYADGCDRWEKPRARVVAWLPIPEYKPDKSKSK